GPEPAKEGRSPASVGGNALVEETELDSGRDEDGGPPSAPRGGLPALDEHTPLQPGPQSDYPSSFAPIYVEVITEEPVEYLAPELPIMTGELTPPAAEESDTRVVSAETQPYPILSEEAGPGHAGDAARRVAATDRP